MARLNYPYAKLSFESPVGFRRIVAPGFLWCGKTPRGERITVQLWKRDTGLQQLAPRSSALAYTHLHRRFPARTLQQGPEDGMQVGGALASLAVLERRQDGRLLQSYHVLVLFAQNLYIFEYLAPPPLATKGVRAFVALLDSVAWEGMPPARESEPSIPDRAPVGAPGKPEGTLQETLRLPYLPRSRATSTKQGGVLDSGL